MTEAWPTEAAATAAVEAVARKAFEDARTETAEATKIPIERYADWEHAGAVVQLQWRQRVLPLVWATIEALPDPRYLVFEEGYEAGRTHSTKGNPYPSGL